MEKRRVNLTISKDILDKIKARADKNYRVLSAEVEYTLLQSLLAPEPTSTPAPFTSIPTPENPTGQSYSPTASTSNTIITADGTTYKKHPLTWLNENNIDPHDHSTATYAKVRSAFPDITLMEFDDYQYKRAKNS